MKERTRKYDLPKGIYPAARPVGSYHVKVSLPKTGSRTKRKVIVVGTFPTLGEAIHRRDLAFAAFGLT